jgi:hypothetical protein
VAPALLEVAQGSSMSGLARHDLDAGDLLVARDERGAVRVHVRVDESTAHLPSVQHTAWMTLNELARLSGIVSEVGLSCPADVPLAGRVVPLAARELDLASALLAGCKEIGIVPVAADGEATGFDRALRIGPGKAEGAIRVHGEGWWGGYCDDRIESVQPDDPNPIGPYVAASLIAGDIFGSVALRDYEPAGTVYLSAWSLLAGTELPVENPSLQELELDTLIVGVGAVGSMVVHVLWAIEAVAGAVVLCDADRKGVDSTNLNRYVLFGKSSLGKQKASEAAAVAADATVDFRPVDEPVQTVERFPPRVVSAVDVNVARAAVQSRYPARILSASTRDLRAEILRVGRPRRGACLRCFNRPEEQPDDHALRQAIQAGEYGALAELAAAHDLTVDEAEEWVLRGECGRASERLLPSLRQELRLPSEFAVSFVSSLAGVLLAAELLKDMFARDVPLGDTNSRFVFQLVAPLFRTNRFAPFLPDPTCPLCGATSNPIAVEAWEERARTLLPGRDAP